MKKIALAIFIILVAGFFSKDFYLVIKLSMYFSFWFSIILLVKYLSRDISDGRKNDYFGE